ncbi:MAG: hypothetical protein RLZZ470_1696 [Pseudomonadota bacterium]|jgi:CRP-like cAMP-binding protein
MTYRQNDILAHLPPDELAQLAPHLELHSLTKGQVLFRHGGAITHIHFPVSAVISLSLQLADGFGAETQMLGHSCLVGVGGFGSATSSSTATVSVAGLAFRVPLLDFQKQFAQGAGLMRSVLCQVRLAGSNMQQSIVCSKHHSLTQQLAKWMLNMHDKNKGDVLDFSHQEIALLLGFRQEGVTVALGLMEAAQLIAMKSKQIELLNHSALEQVACECYQEMRNLEPCTS